MQIYCKYGKIIHIQCAMNIFTYFFSDVIYGNGKAFYAKNTDLLASSGMFPL